MIRRVAMLLGALLAVSGPLAAQHVAVSGAFAYEDKEWDENGWTGERPELPIRGADVSVRDAVSGKVLGRGVTAEDGSFTVLAKVKQPLVDLVVRVEASNRLRRKLVGPFTGIMVKSAAGELYAAESPVFAQHDSSLPLDVGTTVAEPIVIAGDEGSPFNVFDCATAAFEYVAGPVLLAKPKGAVTLTWPSFTGSWVLGRRGWISVDDGFDDAVILHEVGHLVHNLYSDSDSPGGIHYFGDSDQDPRLSFSEGYATFFSGAVQLALGRPAYYMDCNGASAVGGVQLRLCLESGAPYEASIEGSADEVAVACVLHDIADGEDSPDTTPGVDDDSLGVHSLVDGMSPARALWQVFVGPVRKASRLTMNHVWDGWLALFGTDARYDDMRDVFDDKRMRFWVDAFEPDNTPETATLVTPLSGNAWGPEHTLYAEPPGSLKPGTGDRDWFAVDLTAGQVIRVETRYPGGAWDARTQADPFLTLHAPDGSKVASDDDSGPGRNARITGVQVTETGRWLFEVRSRNKTHRYGRYEVRVVVLSGP